MSAAALSVSSASYTDDSDEDYSEADSASESSDTEKFLESVDCDNHEENDADNYNAESNDTLFHKKSASSLTDKLSSSNLFSSSKNKLNESVLPTRSAITSTAASGFSAIASKTAAGTHFNRGLQSQDKSEWKGRKPTRKRPRTAKRNLRGKSGPMHTVLTESMSVEIILCRHFSIIFQYYKLKLIFRIPYKYNST